MKKPLKKLFLTILFLMVVASLFVAVFNYCFTGQFNALSMKEIKLALVSQNLNPVDVTDSFYGKSPDAGLNHCMVAEQRISALSFIVLIIPEVP